MVQNFSFERGNDTQREDGIFSDNFGGLNTTASDLNCPYTDSPLLLNCDVDVSGKVTKRKGTRVLYSRNETGQLGYYIQPFITGLQYTLLVEKFGVNINVFEVNGGNITLLVTKPNVWDSSGATVRPSVTRTSELESRLIFTTGVNQPVQLKFVEQQSTANLAVSNVVVSNAEKFEFATTSNTIIYKNRTRVTPTSIVYSAGTLTLNGVSVVIGDVIDIISITWQHLVEAIYWKGEQVGQSVTRNNSVASDQNVPVPGELLDDVVFDYPGTPYSYGFQAYNSNVWDYTGAGTARYDYQSDGTPATSTEYSMGSGSLYDSSLGGSVTRAPFFVTFGAIDASGNDIEMYLAKRMDLRKYLNGRGQIPGDKIGVYVNETKVNQRTTTLSGSTNQGDYYLIDAAGATETTTAGLARLITFEAATPLGVPEQADIEVLHLTTTYIGSAATTEVEKYKDGACQPLYGIGLFADYLRGSFPRHCAIYENRLVFGGFPGNPNLTVYSEVGDKTIAGQSFRNFQVDEANVDIDSPFDIPLSGRSDDYITGLVQWDRSLFVFGRYSVSRVSYGGDSIFSNLSRQVSLLTTNGLVNSRCVVVTDKNVLYLSDVGVFDLLQGVDSNNFIANEKSLKIRSKFGITKKSDREELAWMSFDPNSRKVYLGLPVEQLDYTSNKLYVYSLFREAWTEYDSIGGFNIYHATNYADMSGTNGFIAATVGYRDGSEVPTNLVLLRFEEPTYLDYVRELTASGSGVNFNMVFDEHIVEQTTTNNVQDYPISLEKSEDSNGFNTMPIEEIEDVYVRLETSAGSGTFSTLTRDVDFIKRPNGYIHLITNPGSGRLLRVSPRLPGTDSESTRAYYGIGSRLAEHKPIIVFLDNVIQTPGVDYNINMNAGIQRATFVSPPTANSIVKTGQCYQAIYTSPTITLTRLAGMKRVKHAFVYFDNQDGQDMYDVDDINTASSQSASEIVGKFKQRLNANIALQYEADYSGEVSYDLYGFNSLVFDDTLYDLYPSANQFRRYALFKEYLLGIGYSYRLMIWSFDDGAFKLAAFQITSNMKADRYINWT